MKTYKLILNDLGHINIHYFINGELDNKEFYSNVDGTNKQIIRYGFISEDLNSLQYEELKVTDWYFVRKVELGIEIPLEIIKQRLEIRAKYDNLKLDL